MKTKGSILIQRDANKWPGILESSRTLFIPKQLHSGTISHQTLLHLLRHVHLGNRCVTLHIDQ